MAADLGGAKGGGGSTAKNAYLQCLRATLNAAICLSNFGCQEIERNNKPEVEMGTSFVFAILVPFVVNARWRSWYFTPLCRSLTRGIDEPCHRVQERERVCAD
jgi:hypothetical protein